MGRKEPQQAPLIQKNGPFGFLGALLFYQLLTLGQARLGDQTVPWMHGMWCSRV
jgi:hypothetical protein